MDGPQAVAGGGGGGGGPAPFLLKTYDMVDDTSTDEIVSWSPSRNSFVVWNPPEFARVLLPTYFKHNNFSSFIRQLNTYGFRKIDPERWEFANEDFVKDQKHLLKNIHRRKPIHSHSNPQGSAVDSERAAFEEEIEKLSREKTTLEGNVLRYKQQQSTVKVHLDEFTQRVSGIEQRQQNLLAYLNKAIEDPDYVQRLTQKLESMDFAAYNKKRRLPQADHPQVQEITSVDNQSSCRPEFGNVFQQDFTDKLRLELSPAVSDINLISDSTQGSNEDGGSPQRRGCWQKDVHMRTEGLFGSPETLDLSDTGASFSLKMDAPTARKVGDTESPNIHLLQQNLTSNEEGDGHISCHLNLTLASSLLQASMSQYSTRTLQSSQDIRKHPEPVSNANGCDTDGGVLPDNKSIPENDGTLSSSHEERTNKQGPASTKVRVNDVFWEQFLTERPGSSDTEEASSSYRANPYDEQEERKSGRGISKNPKNAEHHLSL